MAEVRIERKEGASGWTWLIGLLLLGLIIWWIVAAVSGDRNEAATDPAAPAVTATDPTTGTATTAPGAEAATPNLPLAAIRANPDNYFGKPVSGLATVTEVVSDRGFWVEQDGSRIFVVKDGALDAPAAAVSAGQKASFTGTVINPDGMQEQVPGILDLDESTLKMLQGEPAFIHATNLEMQNS